MEKSQQRLIHFENALHRLQELRAPKNLIERDALVQRFEFTFDLGWKCLKDLLLSKYSREVASPMQSFQEAVRLGLLQEDAVWLKMRDARNLTSHVYSEVLAVEVAQQIIGFINAFETLFALLKTENESQ